MKFTIKRNRRNRRNKSRKGGAPKTMKDNFNNCQNYWASYSSGKCDKPWMHSDTSILPYDIIDYPGAFNKMKGKKPTWLPETSTGLQRKNFKNKEDLKYLEDMKRLNGPMTPYAEVPKELY